MRSERTVMNKRRIIKKIKKHEKKFSANNYSGNNKNSYEILNGKLDIAVTAPHAVGFFENGDKEADAFSGGIARLLAYEIGFHAFLPTSSYDDQQRQSLEKEMNNLCINRNIKAIMEFQTVECEKDVILSIDRDGKEDGTYSFLKRMIKYSFEYKYRNYRKDNIIDTKERTHSSISSNVASYNDITYVFLGINKKYASMRDKDAFAFLLDVLLETMKLLLRLDWNADVIRVYKLQQSRKHKPLDKIEILSSYNDVFKENSLLNICTYDCAPEKVWLHVIKKGRNKQKNDNLHLYLEDEYVFLTNRLIQLLFGREWIEENENEPELDGAPIIVYSSKIEQYPIGLPKANQIDGVYFSSALYEEKKRESDYYDYVIYSRYSDSRLYIDYKKVDYRDYGRVRTSDGKPDKRIMIPRYYKRLLGLLDYPLSMIRKEEYDVIIKQLVNKEEKDAFEKCYTKIEGEVYYKWKDFTIDNEALGQEIKKTKNKVIEVQNRLGLYNNIEILKLPKELKQKKCLKKEIKRAIDTIKNNILEIIVGKSDYLLKTWWTNETDDKNNIARLSCNMMNLLGISENDKIVVRFGIKQEVVLRVLANDQLMDYQIGIPALARKELGMNSINDIVIVNRDMTHIFLRHSEQQVIAILGTVLAIFQVVQQVRRGVILCAIMIPLIIYFIFNEERIKVK